MLFRTIDCLSPSLPPSPLSWSIMIKYFESAPMCCVFFFLSIFRDCIPSTWNALPFCVTKEITTYPVGLSSSGSVSTQLFSALSSQKYDAFRCSFASAPLVLPSHVITVITLLYSYFPYKLVNSIF